LRLLRGMIVDRKGNLPELEVRGSDVIEVRGLFFLDLVFEDADVVVSRNLDREHPLFVVTENKAVEQKICHEKTRCWYLFRHCTTQQLPSLLSSVWITGASQFSVTRSRDTTMLVMEVGFLIHQCKEDITIHTYRAVMAEVGALSFFCRRNFFVQWRLVLHLFRRAWNIEICPIYCTVGAVLKFFIAIVIQGILRLVLSAQSRSITIHKRELTFRLRISGPGSWLALQLELDAVLSCWSWYVLS
jgi:hypothetical protein